MRDEPGLSPLPGPWASAAAITNERNHRSDCGSGCRHNGEVTGDRCLLCRVEEADAHFGRTCVWADPYWRLSVVLHGPVAGFAHLEPHRHIPYVTDLDGPEAATLGPVLARVTAAMRSATGADKIYVYVFGDRVPHLHLNLAPHRPGDALVGGPGLLRPGAPDADPVAHWTAAEAVRHALRDAN